MTRFLSFLQKWCAVLIRLFGKSKTKMASLSVLVILIIGLCIPAQYQIPVLHATSHDWHAQSFWYSPWGKSGVHKGIDIFAAEGTPVISTSWGIVIFKGYLRRGGNVVAVLGPKWRIYYYAHLQHTDVHVAQVVSKRDVMGTVGTTGNAINKPAHLHFAVLTPLPYLWQVDTGPAGLLKMFFVNPIKLIQPAP